MDTCLYHQFAEIERDHWWFRARREITSAVLQQRLAPHRERHILDVGCGTGGMLQMLTRFGSVCGLDMSPEAIEYCRSRLGAEVELRVGKLPDDLPGCTAWDLVTAFDVIEHLDDDVSALAGIAHILAPEGFFLCTVPAFSFLWGPHDDLNHHRRRYTRKDLARSLAAAGLDIVWLTYFNSWLFPVVAGVRLTRRLVAREGQVPKSDFFLPPEWSNRALTRLFASEAQLLRHVSLPVGVSLMALCRKSTAA